MALEMRERAIRAKRRLWGSTDLFDATEWCGSVRRGAGRQAKYDVEQAVAEIDKAVVFGYQRKNPMSVAKLLELKAKLYGLLVDRIQVETVDMKGALLEARTRTFGPINITPGQTLALASATPTTGAASADSTANIEKKWKPFSE